MKRISFVAAVNKNILHRPSLGPRVISISKSTWLNFKRLKHCNIYKSEDKNIVIPFIIYKKRFSTNKNVDLGERFRNDAEAKSLMQELLKDFGRTEPITYEERKIVDSQLGSNTVSSIDIPVIQENKHRVSELSQSNIRKDLDCKYVFEIGELVDILKEENASDVCVIKIPRKMRYVDYLVLATGRSTRHLKAMSQNFNKEYKELKAEHHKFLTIEGKNSDDWMCIDFGNIVLHFMLEETREVYELEKLWTLGPEFDDQSQRMDVYEMHMFDAENDMATIEQESDAIEDQGSQDGVDPEIHLK